MGTVNQGTTVLVAGLMLAACQGPEGPMGPAASMKTSAIQEDGCVVINISGDNMTVNGVEDANVGQTDTVYVTAEGEALPSGPFQWKELYFDSRDHMEWLNARKGWLYYGEGITQQTAKVYLRQRFGFSSDFGVALEWTPFDEFVERFDEDDRPTLTITDATGEIFIHDPERQLDAHYDDANQFITFRLGLRLAVE